MDAVVAHPEPRVRRALARNGHVPPAQRGRLAADPLAMVRAELAAGPRPRPRRMPPLPDEVLVALLTAVDDEADVLTADEIAQQLLVSGQLPASFRHRALRHEHPAVRICGAALWERLTPAERGALRTDPDPRVREVARHCARQEDPAAMEADLPEEDCHARAGILTNFAVSHTVAEACLATGRNLEGLAANRHTPAHAVARLARAADPEVRARVAARADLAPTVWAELAEDPDERVRTRARIQPLPRTRAECAAVDRVLACHGHDCDCPVVEPYEQPDPDWYRACAVSPEVVLRRVAASCPTLPAGLVARLAEDPDDEVRHRLACHHPSAPPATVLDTFVARPRQRPHLLAQSRLPRTGLAHLLGHEDPQVRAWAAGDPSLGRAPVALLADPDAHVRRAAAANPLFTGAVLDALLQDPATAQGAAANPGLPAVRLHALLDRAGLPR
ncbi:hypothetical protein [Streptomyces sp. WAC06614]|uniref:hypothetical protein n=1 Tax=Streptomyces sp. WAC06614 TaxID=2487416 RepID=UPI0021AF0097|nr:hypothetical protein [Streptomyces sp. WAC06614]